MKNRSTFCTSQKGITLIALIITIIVMLILVGVTINVALNEGLFDTAETAADLTTVEAEKEALSMAAIAAWTVEDGVDFDAMELPEGFESLSTGTYKSRESGKTYKVDKATAKVTEGGAQEIDDDLAYMRAEMLGKTLNEVVDMDASTAAGTVIFKNSAIIFKEWWSWGDVYQGSIVSYNEKEFLAYYENDGSENPEIIFVYYYALDNNDYFDIFISPEGAVIRGLTENGSSSLAATKKLVIPKTILGTDGKNYDITELDGGAFNGNLYIEQLEFESGSKLVEIGEYAFEGCTNLSGTVVIPSSVTTIYYEAFRNCTSIESITIPSSVDNLGRGVFNGWTSTQTIYMQRTEEPTNTDEYTGELGWYKGWKDGCNARIVWGQ